MAANHGSARNAHIVGWGMAVPERILTNRDLEAIADTSDEWIQERTGIRERRIAGEEESTATLGFAAARRALAVANMLPTEIDMIIVATSTPEHIFPSTASLIQDALGASSAGAFDLSAACTGFLYGLHLAAQAVVSGSINAALVIGSETMSRLLDWEDRGTCILFGDGAGAVVLKASPVPGGILAATLRSDGSGRDLLSAPTVGSQNARLPLFPSAGSSPGPVMHRLTMNGREVFRFATRVMKESVEEVVNKAGLTLDDVDWVVPHQANQRIIDHAAKALDIAPERFIRNLDRYGNTSAASIPIALCEAINDGRIKPDNTLVMVAFGAGLTWGALAIKWGMAPPPEPARMVRYRREAIIVLAHWRSHLARLLRRLTGLISRTPLSRVYHKIDPVPPEEDNEKGPTRHG